MAGEPRGQRRYSKVDKSRQTKIPPPREEDYDPETGKLKKKRRSRIDIPLETFRKLCELQCSQVELGDFFGCSEGTIKNRIKEDPDYEEAWKKGMATGKISIRRAQMRAVQDPQSKGHATMLVWLGKIFLQQRDSQDLNISNKDEAAKGPYQHPFVTEDEANAVEVTDGKDEAQLH
jgi:hypothetical protein